MTDREPVARCSHCVELNVLSARYCKHCGHEAHGFREDCRCRRCLAVRVPEDIAVVPLPNGSAALIEVHAPPDAA